VSVASVASEVSVRKAMPSPIVRVLPSAFVEDEAIALDTWRPLSDVVLNIVRHVEVQSAVPSGVSGGAELLKAA
jgi:hypothetical protein